MAQTVENGKGAGKFQKGNGMTSFQVNSNAPRLAIDTRDILALLSALNVSSITDCDPVAIGNKAAKSQDTNKTAVGDGSLILNGFRPVANRVS